MKPLEEMLITQQALRQRRTPSVMNIPPAPQWQPEYEKEPPLEQVSPEDFIPNPKSAVAALKGMPLLAGTFIGPNSPLWKPNSAAAANLRLAGGETPATVWAALRTGHLPEGPMAQEISDVGTDIDMAALMKQSPKTLMRMGDVAHGPLFDAYPSLKEYRVGVDPSIPGQGQHLRYVGQEHLNTVKLNPAKMGGDPDLPRSTLLHELGGHAVQNKEGWHGGATSVQDKIDFKHLDPYQQATLQEFISKAPTTPANGDLLSTLKQLLVENNKSKFAPPSVHNANIDLFNKILTDQKTRDKVAFKNYQDAYGEAMARLIQSRAGHLNRNLAHKYPFDPDYFKQVTGSAINELRKP